MAILFLFILFNSVLSLQKKKKKNPTDCDLLSWFDYTSLMGHNPCDLKNIVNNNSNNQHFWDTLYTTLSNKPKEISALGCLFSLH